MNNNNNQVGGIDYLSSALTSDLIFHHFRPNGLTFQKLEALREEGRLPCFLEDADLDALRLVNKQLNRAVVRVIERELLHLISAFNAFFPKSIGSNNVRKRISEVSQQGWGSVARMRLIVDDYRDRAGNRLHELSIKNLSIFWALEDRHKKSRSLSISAYRYIESTFGCAEIWAEWKGARLVPDVRFKPHSEHTKIIKLCIEKNFLSMAAHFSRLMDKIDPELDYSYDFVKTCIARGDIARALGIARTISDCYGRYISLKMILDHCEDSENFSKGRMVAELMFEEFTQKNRECDSCMFNALAFFELEGIDSIQAIQASLAEGAIAKAVKIAADSELRVSQHLFLRNSWNYAVLDTVKAFIHSGNLAEAKELASLLNNNLCKRQALDAIAAASVKP